MFAAGSDDTLETGFRSVHTVNMFSLFVPEGQKNISSCVSSVRSTKTPEYTHSVTSYSPAFNFTYGQNSENTVTVFLSY